MMMQLTMQRFATTAIAAAALGLGAAATATAHSPRTETTVTVFGDRYVAGGRAFDDLNALEGAVTASRASAVRLDACGPGIARSLLAAGHRFRRLPLQLRVLSDDDPACNSSVPATMRVTMRVDQRPYNIDDAAVAHYWHRMLP